jgi:type II secretory pathway pseudopilin PulG
MIIPCFGSMRRRAAQGHGRGGVTLLEVVVALGVVALFTGLLIRAGSQGRQQANREQSRMELQNLQLAMRNYQADFRTLPGGDMENVIFSLNGRYYPFPIGRLEYRPQE